MTNETPLLINPPVPTTDWEQTDMNFCQTNVEISPTEHHYDEMQNSFDKKTAKTKGASLPPNWWSNVPLRRYMF